MFDHKDDEFPVEKGNPLSRTYPAVQQDEPRYAAIKWEVPMYLGRDVEPTTHLFRGQRYRLGDIMAKGLRDVL